MRTKVELTAAMLRAAQRMLAGSVRGIEIEHALKAAGGYRSMLGVVKHTAGWAHVYHSYAFDASPKHWHQADWPLGLRDTIEPTQAYLDAVIAWLEAACERWIASVGELSDEQIDEPRPCHWGGSAPLFDIALMVANHWSYHAGEINMLDSIVRSQAWEYSEEVEENHISTAGHRLRPDWMSDDQAAKYEAYLAVRDAQLHRDAPSS